MAKPIPTKLFSIKVINIKKTFISQLNHIVFENLARLVGERCENFGLDTIQRFPELLKPKSFVKLISEKSFIEQIEKLTGTYARVRNSKTD